MFNCVSIREAWGNRRRVCVAAQICRTYNGQTYARPICGGSLRNLSLFVCSLNYEQGGSWQKMRFTFWSSDCLTVQTYMCMLQYYMLSLFVWDGDLKEQILSEHKASVQIAYSTIAVHVNPLCLVIQKCDDTVQSLVNRPCVCHIAISRGNSVLALPRADMQQKNWFDHPVQMEPAYSTTWLRWLPTYFSCLQRCNSLFRLFQPCFQYKRTKEYCWQLW